MPAGIFSDSDALENPTSSLSLGLRGRLPRVLPVPRARKSHPADPRHRSAIAPGKDFTSLGDRSAFAVYTAFVGNARIVDTNDWVYCGVPQMRPPDFPRFRLRWWAIKISSHRQSCGVRLSKRLAG